MEPPANRRSGNSRRAQYSVFFGYIAGGAGAAVGLLLLIAAFGNPHFMSGLRGFGAGVAAPVSRTATAGKMQSQTLVESVSGYLAAGKQNAELKRELTEAKIQLIAAKAQSQENLRLKALLGIAEGEVKPIAIARLIGATSSSSRRFATLGAGSREGVAVGMPVRSPLGLVGRVLEVSRTTSRVLLITDSESVVPIRRAHDSLPAFAQGRGDGTVQIRLINLGVNPLKKGDTFVTSGSGGLFRPGTPIAIVQKPNSDGAIGRVLGDAGSSDYVAVEPEWTALAKPSISPPAPTQ